VVVQQDAVAAEHGQRPPPPVRRHPRHPERWDLIHTGRVLLDSAGFALIAVHLPAAGSAGPRHPPRHRGRRAGLFITRGYGGTTVDAIAEAADVSRKTVFTSVGGKIEALKLAIEWAIAGDDEPVPMTERPHVKAAQAEPDARRILAGYARTVRQVSGRIAPLTAVVQAAAGLDAALAEEGRAQRIRGMRFLAQLLADRGALKPDLTTFEAADILWLLNDPGVYHRLVIEQHWPPDRYEHWLADAFISLLIPPATGQRRPEPRI
jgi:AcrR family transcriptional regulator